MNPQFMCATLGRSFPTKVQTEMIVYVKKKNWEQLQTKYD